MALDAIEAKRGSMQFPERLKSFLGKPNTLTLFRVVAVPLIIALMSVPNRLTCLLAGLIFSAAAITDYFDGHLARQKGMVSNFGKVMDPLADKLLARHIRMGAFLDAMPPKMEKTFLIIISLISAFVMAIMTWFSYKYLMNAMDMGHMTPALRVPKWTFYVIIPIGFGLACIQYIRTIIKNFTEKDPWQSPDQQSEYEDEQIGGASL